MCIYICTDRRKRDRRKRDTERERESQRERESDREREGDSEREREQTESASMAYVQYRRFAEGDGIPGCCIRREIRRRALRAHRPRLHLPCHPEGPADSGTHQGTASWDVPPSTKSPHIIIPTRDC